MGMNSHLLVGDLVHPVGCSLQVIVSEPLMKQVAKASLQYLGDSVMK
jgi:hypothetical protein